jgi:hypothetical protein
MSRRGNKQRQRERKARNREERARPTAHDPAYDEPWTEARHQRVLQKFSCLRSRGLVLRFETLGLTVKASNPEELHRETLKALAEMTKGQIPS